MSVYVIAKQVRRQIVEHQRYRQEADGGDGKQRADDWERHSFISIGHRIKRTQHGRLVTPLRCNDVGIAASFLVRRRTRKGKRKRRGLAGRDWRKTKRESKGNTSHNPHAGWSVEDGAGPPKKEERGSAGNCPQRKWGKDFDSSISTQCSPLVQICRRCRG